MSGLNAARGPRITVIIATFNCASLLPRAIASFLEQDYEDKELLIVDGGSTDGTLEVIRAHAPSIAWWVSEPDKGIYDAWNKAIPHAGGQWIIFLGSDDTFWDAHSLRDAAPSLAAAPANVGFAYGRAAMVAEYGRVAYVMGADWPVTSRLLRHVMAVSHTATFQRAQAFKGAGAFNPRYKLAGDYELLLRWLTRAGLSGAFLPLTVVRAQLGGLSDQQLILALREMIRARAELGLPGPAWRLRFEILKRRSKSLLRRALGEAATRGLARIARRLRAALTPPAARTATYPEDEPNA